MMKRGRRACRNIIYYQGCRLSISMLALSVVAIISCCSDHRHVRSTLVVATAASAAAAAAASSTVPAKSKTTSASSIGESPSKSSSSSSQTVPPTTNQNRFDMTIPRVLKSFFEKFDSVGPTLTLTLRDPTSMSLLGRSSDYNYRPDCYSFSGEGGGSTGKISASSQSSSILGPESKKMVAAGTTTDDGTFGISSKIAALFHISPTTYPANKYGQPTSAGTSSTTTTTTSQFAHGYMLDDGDILLEPTSSSSFSSSPYGDTSSSSSSSSRVRQVVSDRIINTRWANKKSWSECVRNVHPELKFEIHTRRRHPSITIATTSPTNNASIATANNIEDTRPFPIIAPWLAALTFCTKWTPFPMYHYPEDSNGYGHKVMSTPHFVRARATIHLPRLSTLVQRLTSTNLGDTKQFSLVDGGDRSNEVDLSLTYQKRPYSFHDGDGTVELVLGSPKSTLSPATKSRAILDKYRKNNHLLVRLATGRWKRGHTNNNYGSRLMPTTLTTNSSNDPSSFTLLPLSSSIEYIKASFRIPNPLFLCSKGVSISPSYNFLDGNARCVFSGDVGSSGRTRAVLRLDAYDSTLTLVRALDENKIIAPTISLNSGKIVYDYYLNLDGSSRIKSSLNADATRKVNSSIRAHVDPTTGIVIKWTDGINQAGGGVGNEGSCWVTECRVPLGTSGPGPLAADVRVGRRWVIG